MDYNDELIYGKNDKRNIVGIEVDDGSATLIIDDGNGPTYEVIPHERYILHKERPYKGRVGTLKGDQPFCFFSAHKTLNEYSEMKKNLRWGEYYTPFCDKMGVMLKEGYTYYKGMELNDLNILSFDIETTGVTIDDTSTVLMISNTFKKRGKLTRKLFSLDEYENQAAMIFAWSKWVVEQDPHVLAGHNILRFDLPYLRHCSGGELFLGRGGKPIEFSERTRKFRKDGSQSYDYNDVKVYGRETVDTFMLAIKYDVMRKYPSYKLKDIIEFEGKEKKDRIKWDFTNLNGGKVYASFKQGNTKLWEEFKDYCRDDADDAITLCDIFLPSFFYYCQTLPMGLQELVLTASGTQVNSIMVRSYLQRGHSIAEPSAKVEYEGGISFGECGIYKHVNKIDVASLYPSIIISSKVQDRRKDPEGNFLKIIETLTAGRLENKRLAKETGDRKYKDLEQAQKIIINSGYGFLGAGGLNYNAPELAAFVTAKGREYLTDAIDHAKDILGYEIVNADTDSFSYTRGRKLTDEEFEADIAEINKLSPEGINWEDDGRYKTVVVVKAKNYVLVPYKGEKTIKGSSLKATMKETALREFIGEILEELCGAKLSRITTIYDKYALEIYSVKDISRWASKKTITKSVLNPERTNEKRVLDAIKNKDFSEGDKVFMFFETPEKLTLVEDFTGKYCQTTLYNKLYKTMAIFDTLIPMNMIPNYSLKSMQDMIITKGEAHEAYNNIASITTNRRISKRPKTEVTKSAATRVRKCTSSDDSFF